jgi:hypothetical protein
MTPPLIMKPSSYITHLIMIKFMTQHRHPSSLYNGFAFVPSNVGVHLLATRYSIEHASSIAKRGMFRSESPHALTFLEPHKPACLAVSRNVKKLGRRPSELDCAARPLVEKPASVIDRQPPFRFGNLCRPLALELRPSVKVALRHAAHCHAFTFLKLGLSGFGRPFNSRNTPTLVTLKRFKNPF